MLNGLSEHPGSAGLWQKGAPHGGSGPAPACGGPAGSCLCVGGAAVERREPQAGGLQRGRPGLGTARATVGPDGPHAMRHVFTALRRGKLNVRVAILNFPLGTCLLVCPQGIKGTTQNAPGAADSVGEAVCADWEPRAALCWCHWSVSPGGWVSFSSRWPLACPQPLEPWALNKQYGMKTSESSHPPQQ